MTRSTKISESEWEVMSVIWRDSPITAQRVIDSLGHASWSPKTIKTLLSRLVKKGILGFETEANRYLYFPLVDRDSAVREEASGFVDRVFGGDLRATLLHFAQKVDLSSEEVERLRGLLDEEAGLDSEEEGS